MVSQNKAFFSGIGTTKVADDSSGTFLKTIVKIENNQPNNFISKNLPQSLEHDRWRLISFKISTQSNKSLTIFKINNNNIYKLTMFLSEIKKRRQMWKIRFENI